MNATDVEEHVVENTPASSAGVEGWRELSDVEVPAWSECLLRTSASVFQFPFWNEPFKRMYMKPRYLVYDSEGGPVAYVCVLTIRLLFWRIGIVQRGPVSLHYGEIPMHVLRDLFRWMVSERFIFIRFSHSAPSFLDRLGKAMPGKRVDAFPYYSDFPDELTVSLEPDEEEILAGFQPTARRKIRKAAEEQYRLKSSTDPGEMVVAWPLFERLARRKGFQFRPLEGYLDIMRHAAGVDGVRVYSAELDGRLVEVLFLVRDASTAYYISGALDTEALAGRESPSCLLHWTAMRDFRGMGIKKYHLGTRSVFQFKRQFRPLHVVNPPALTVISNEALFLLWDYAALRGADRLRPILRRAVAMASLWLKGGRHNRAELRTETMNDAVADQ